ncbi:hypothetical protein D5086_006653 [Populus alba]|uniref:Uncharacterized protein n=1 Tax=Populus alba TaxID=43335 RepID=A0ACC4CLL4_POPAL
MTFLCLPKFRLLVDWGKGQMEHPPIMDDSENVHPKPSTVLTPFSMLWELDFESVCLLNYYTVHPDKKTDLRILEVMFL